MSCSIGLFMTFIADVVCVWWGREMFVRWGPFKKNKFLYKVYIKIWRNFLLLGRYRRHESMLGHLLFYSLSYLQMKILSAGSMPGARKGSHNIITKTCYLCSKNFFSSRKHRNKLVETLHDKSCNWGRTDARRGCGRASDQP